MTTVIKKRLNDLPEISLKARKYVMQYKNILIKIKFKDMALVKLINFISMEN